MIKYKTFVGFCTVLLCLGLLSFTTKAQSVQQGLNAETHKDSRLRLTERLKVLVDLQRAREYEKLYDLLLFNGEAETKESFVKINKAFDKSGRSPLMKFVATEIYLIEPGGHEGLIKGCAAYQANGKRKSLQSQVQVVYRNNDWFFRSLVSVALGPGSTEQRCNAGR